MRIVTKGQRERIGGRHLPELTAAVPSTSALSTPQQALQANTKSFPDLLQRPLRIPLCTVCFGSPLVTFSAVVWCSLFTHCTSVFNTQLHMNTTTQSRPLASLKTHSNTQAMIMHWPPHKITKANSKGKLVWCKHIQNLDVKAKILSKIK